MMDTRYDLRRGECEECGRWAVLLEVDPDTLWDLCESCCRARLRRALRALTKTINSTGTLRSADGERVRARVGFWTDCVGAFAVAGRVLA